MTHSVSTTARPEPALPPEAVAEAASEPAMAPDWAERVVEEFGAYIREELRRTHAAGRAYSTLVDGRVAWVHPDGALRVGMAADSALFHGE